MKAPRRKGLDDELHPNVMAQKMQGKVNASRNPRKVDPKPSASRRSRASDWKEDLCKYMRYLHRRSQVVRMPKKLLHIQMSGCWKATSKRRQVFTRAFFGCIRRPVLNIATPEPRPLARWAKFGQMCYVDCSSIEQDATFQFVGTPLLRTCDQGSCTPWTLCAERCQEPRNWSGGTRVKLILEGCQPCSIWRERSRGGGCGGFLPGIVREKHSDTEMKTSRLSST